MLSEGGGLTIIGGRLAATRQDDARRLQDLIARAASGEREQRTGGSMGLTTPCRRRPLSLIISPMRGDRAALFPSGPAVMVCATDLEASVSPPEQQLRELFGLTPAEGRVALALLEGLEPAQAARRLGLGLPTVRTHLAHVFDKTETTGQVALTNLMMRAVGILPP
ncbi:MAG: helix-turn-helix transcriptional regulator [Pseudomonadota bacterium]|nr:helix-turn-helix transcriptional regulator [Pseudomonadota bacterium]